MKRLSLIPAGVAVCLALAGTAHAADITWTGAVSDFWWEAGNWSGDANFYSDGDNVVINGPATLALNWKQQTGDPNLPSDPPVAPGSVTVDTTGGDVSLQWGWGPWGSSAFKGSGTITKTGPGTWRWWDESGYWSTPVSTVYNIDEGVLQTGHHHELGWTGTFGGGATVNLNGGEFWYNTWSEKLIEWNATGDINVTADSNIRVTDSHADGWAEAGFNVSVDAGATLTMISSNGPVDWDNVLEIDLADDLSGKMVIKSNLELEDDATLVLNVTGTQTQTEFVLVDYSGGTLTGTFATVTGLPADANIDYDGTDTNPDAIVLLFPSLLLGDVNNDGNVDNLDITPFIAALSAEDEPAFVLLYPAGKYWAADVNEDGNVDNLDITPFVGVLGGGSAVPEPASMLLIGLGAAGVALRRRRR